MSEVSWPRSAPLSSIEALLSWIATDSSPAIPIQRRMRLNRHQPRLLVCHDMAGGYVEDFDNQCYAHHFPNNNSDVPQVYHCEYWTFTDIFIYFSHHRVTRPPRTWICSAHRSGVLILGTFITEWEAGQKDLLEMLQNSNKFERSISQLVQIAKTDGFDGWFINIENPVPTSLIPKLMEWLTLLKKALKQQIPHSKLIWYDSVTIQGSLRWQDRLSDLNKPFFNITDGLFTNYTWQESFPKQSAQLARKRRFQIYTGIDIWGRNTFGGGGFDTFKALKVIQQAGTSAALFAPAWTYEHLPKEQFRANDARLWIGSRAQDPTCIAHYFSTRPVPSLSYFYTDFCTGFGYQFAINGERVQSGSWHHLAHQSPLLSFHHESYDWVEQGDEIRIGSVIPYQWHYNYSEAFHGGSSLTIERKVFMSLFKLTMPVVEMNSLCIEMAYKTDSQVECIVAFVFDINNGAKLVVSPNKRISLSNATGSVSVVAESSRLGDWHLLKYQFTKSSYNSLFDYNRICPLLIEKCSILTNTKVHLGMLRLFYSDWKKPFEKIRLEIKSKERRNDQIMGFLHWQSCNSVLMWHVYMKINEKWQFIGSAFEPKFRWIATSSSTSLLVQTVNVFGQVEPFSECSQILIN